MEPTQYEKDTREMLEMRFTALDGVLKRIERIVTNHLVHRLPVWATLSFAALTGIVTALLAIVLR